MSTNRQDKITNINKIIQTLELAKTNPAKTNTVASGVALVGLSSIIGISTWLFKMAAEPVRHAIAYENARISDKPWGAYFNKITPESAVVMCPQFSHDQEHQDLSEKDYSWHNICRSLSQQENAANRLALSFSKCRHLNWELCHI